MVSVQVQATQGTQQVQQQDMHAAEVLPVAGAAVQRPCLSASWARTARLAMRRARS